MEVAICNKFPVIITSRNRCFSSQIYTYNWVWHFSNSLPERRLSTHTLPILWSWCLWIHKLKNQKRLKRDKNQCLYITMLEGGFRSYIWISRWGLSCKLPIMPISLYFEFLWDVCMHVTVKNGGPCFVNEHYSRTRVAWKGRKNWFWQENKQCQ